MWKIYAKTKDIGEVYIYGEITSEEWFEDDVTPQKFKKELDALGSIKELNIYINSIGGDVFAGQAVASLLQRVDAKKHVFIDGLAASIATMPLTIADKVTIADRGMIMIHNAWSFVSGTAKDMLERAKVLEKIDGVLVSGYAKLTGKTDEEIREWMAAETWMTAQEAVDRGFAHEISEAMEVAACLQDKTLIVNGVEMNVDGLKKDWESIVDKEPEQPEQQTNDNGEETQPVADKEQEQIQDLTEQRKQIKRLNEKLKYGG